MRTLHSLTLARLTTLALILAALLPATVAAQNAETSYTDSTHNVTIGWNPQWNAQLPTGGASIFSLERDKSIVVVIGIFDGETVSPEDAVWQMYDTGDEIIADNSSDVPPRLELGYVDSGLVYTIEAYSVNDGATTVMVAAGTIPVLQSSAVGIVQNDITINGHAVLTGMPLGESGTPQDLTGDSTPQVETQTSRTGRSTTQTTDATVEATEETTRTSRTSRGTEVTPEATEIAEATEESTTVVTRTSRSGSGTSETPEANEDLVENISEVTTPEATEEPTEPVTESLSPDSFTSEAFGFSFSYNPNVWQPSESSIENPSPNGIRLDGDTATAFFWGVSDYGADPVGCLEAEHAYYGNDVDFISNWQVAIGASGDPLWSEGADLSWGVFTYTYTSSSGQEVEFVDYISCETIPGHDAVLVVHLTSFPEDYNTNLDDVLDVLDTLEFQP